MSQNTVRHNDFYNEYHGHRTEDLERVWKSLVSSSSSPSSQALSVASENEDSNQNAIIFLAGDSTMDNKFWLLAGGKRVPACNGYESVIHPPLAVPDIAYAVNKYAAAAGAASSSSSAGTGAVRFRCINTAVEESTLGQRTDGSTASVESVHNNPKDNKGGICSRVCGSGDTTKRQRSPSSSKQPADKKSKPFYYAHDAFIHEHLRSGDVIVVSAGGNDIALRPQPRTIAAILWLARFASKKNIENGTAWGLEYMTKKFFKPKYEEYLNHLLSEVNNAVVTSSGHPTREEGEEEAAATTAASNGGEGRRPPQQQRRCALIVPAMLYHLDENKDAPSWANTTLKAIGYNKDPTWIQKIISHAFHNALCKLQLAEHHNQYGVGAHGITDEPAAGGKKCGIKIAPVAMSVVLDGKDTKDYVARVEPSAQGSDKLGRLLVDHIQKHYPY